MRIRGPITGFNYSFYLNEFLFFFFFLINLKRIKNRLRSSLGQDILDGLRILSIENYITASINFDGVIDAFAEKITGKHFFFFLILKIF
jgi:hypothetical protein